MLRLRSKLWFAGVVVASFALVGCSALLGPKDSSTTTTTTDSTAQAHVYMSGAVWSTAGGHPAYWADAQLHLLPEPSSASGAYTGGVATDSAGNVYISGVSSDNKTIGYWKNEVFTPLSLGTWGAITVGPIAVDTTGKVWMTGLAGATASTESTWVYWSGSSGPTLLPGSPKGAWGILADTSGNVYMIGTEPAGSDQVPYVWKNGGTPTPVPLADGNSYGYFGVGGLDPSGNPVFFGNQWGGVSAMYTWTFGATSVTKLPLGTYGPYWLSGTGFAYDGTNFAFVTDWGPSGANGPDTRLFSASPTAVPTVMTLPTGYSKFRAGAGNGSYGPDGNFLLPGQVGNTYKNGDYWNLSDGVPVYWNNATPVLLPMGTGNTNGNVDHVAVWAPKGLASANLTAVPSAPTNVTAAAVTTGDGQVSLTWDPVAGASLYTVYQANGSTVTKATAAAVQTTTTASLTFESLPQGTQLAFLVTASNSGGESAASSVATATLATTTTHVYISGNVGGYLAYWKDGVLTTLGQQDGSGGALITADAGGLVSMAVNKNNSPYVWTGGKGGSQAALPLPNPLPTTGATFGGFNGIGMTTDGHLYISGTLSLNDGNGNSYPVVWKDGALLAIDLGTDNSGYAGAVAVQGTSVIIAGNSGPINNSHNLCVWDGAGVRTVLNPGADFDNGRSGPNSNGILTAGGSIFVYGDSNGAPVGWKSTDWTVPAIQWTNSDSTVHFHTSEVAATADLAHGYAVGFRQTQTDSDANNPVGVPAIWTDGTPGVLPLPSGIANGSATFVGVSGTDVYVAGQSFLWANSTQPTASTVVPLYWKNSTLVPLSLTSALPNAVVCALAVSGSDVYVTAEAGTYSTSNQGIDGNLGPNRAVYWKNGVLNVLPLGGFGGSSMGDLKVF
jgi:hypothetical protein